MFEEIIRVVCENWIAFGIGTLFLTLAIVAFVLEEKNTTYFDESDPRCSPWG